jgi:hypothetical protein
MLKTYHRIITEQSLGTHFSKQALKVVIAANLGQDHWFRGQIGHPEYHFDENKFVESDAYMENNRAAIRPSLEAGNFLVAQKAFGRLLHAAQDFYAHSNYIKRWLDRFPDNRQPLPEEIAFLDRNLLKDPLLRSGKIYWPLEPLSWIPWIGRWFNRFLPHDSHAWMNLDSPSQGPCFDYAFAAAIKRTSYEFEMTVDGLSPKSYGLFCNE